MDKHRIDSHKLMFHVGRVNDWMLEKTTYPIYMEASPSGACNHRCTFCGLDFMEYRASFLDAELFNTRLTEMASLGLKSIMYGGEGEPFLHKQLVEILLHGAGAGLDNAITTNGVLFSPEKAGAVLPVTSWIKVSINAGTRETYAAIHQTKEDDFDKVISNLSEAARLRKKNSGSCTLGMQMILLPENRSEAVGLAQTARDIGMDYLVIKPYSQHLMSNTNTYKNIAYNDDEALAAELDELNSDTFNVIFRTHTMEKLLEDDRQYKRCLALPFWSYIDSDGNVWGCSCYLGDKRFLYGNIYEETFREIWEGSEREKSLKMVAENLDTSSCRVNCRMDEINKYLWELKHPGGHVNFI